MKNHTTYLLFIFLLILQSAFSQEEVKKHPLLTDKFVFNGGLFFPANSIKLSVDGEAIDNEIDFGKSVDIKNYQGTFDLGFEWRFGKKWKLFAEYYQINNTTKAALDEPIKWGDYEFDADVKLGTQVGVLRVMVGWIFWQGPKHEFGVGVGAHGMIFKAFIEGDATLTGPDGSNTTGFNRQSVDGVLPLPDIGLWYIWAPTHRWSLSANVDWLYVSIGEYEGGLWDATGAVQFQVVKFFGVGINYKYYTANLAVNQGNDIGDWRGDVRVTYNGPMVMVNFNF
jgi:hypothetical protein